nr:MAG TPA: hypothetical protein [Caudoviricetes sp.]
MSREKVFNCGLWYDGKLHKGIYFGGAEHNALLAEGTRTQEGAVFQKEWKQIGYAMKLSNRTDNLNNKAWVCAVQTDGGGAALCPDGTWCATGGNGGPPVMSGEYTFFGVIKRYTLQIRKSGYTGYSPLFTALGNVGWYCSDPDGYTAGSYWDYCIADTSPGSEIYDFWLGYSFNNSHGNSYRKYYDDAMSPSLLGNVTDFEWGDGAFVIKPPYKVKGTVLPDVVAMDNAFRCSSLAKIPAQALLKIDADTEIFGMNNTFEFTPLTEIPSGCLAGLRARAWNETFAYCHKLKTLPDELIGGTLGTKNGACFHGTFWECHGLEQLPNRLYKKGTLQEPFRADAMFFNCKKLKSIPATLFEGCEGVLEGAEAMFMGAFDPTADVRVPGTLLQPLAAAADKNPQCIMGMFARSGIRTVDAGLLKPFVGKNVRLNQGNGLYGLFAGSAIESVPKGLFDGICVTKDHNFYTVFQGCEKLVSVPDDVFDHLDWTGDFNPGMRGMGSFFYASFLGCTSLKRLPPLWTKFGTRTEEKETYPGVTRYYAFATATFRYCTNASNYKECPDWCKYENVNSDGYCEITKEEYDRINRLNEANQKA